MLEYKDKKNRTHVQTLTYHARTCPIHRLFGMSKVWSGVIGVSMQRERRFFLGTCFKLEMIQIFFRLLWSFYWMFQTKAHLLFVVTNRVLAIRNHTTALLDATCLVRNGWIQLCKLGRDSAVDTRVGMKLESFRIRSLSFVRLFKRMMLSGIQGVGFSHRSCLLIQIDR